jgi:DnaJ-class molecular chaperone
MSVDFYSILGVPNDCSHLDIKRMYKSLAFKYHPDKNMHKTDSERREFEEILKTINHAYETLGNPEKRKLYDDKITLDQTWGSVCNLILSIQSVTEGFGSLIFHIIAIPLLVIAWTGVRIGNVLLFGDNKIKGDPVYVDIYVELEDLYNGAAILTNHQRFNHIDQTTEIKDISIYVMPGWKEGTKVTFKNYGDILKDAEPADVIYVVKQKPHSRFKRIDNDLVTTIDLSHSDFKATDRSEQSITCIDDERINIDARDLIDDPSIIYRIIGKGMPIRKQGRLIGRGDLLVKFIMHLSQDSSE